MSEANGSMCGQIVEVTPRLGRWRSSEPPEPNVIEVGVIPQLLAERRIMKKSACWLACMLFFGLVSASGSAAQNPPPKVRSEIDNLTQVLIQHPSEKALKDAESWLGKNEKHLKNYSEYQYLWAMLDANRSDWSKADAAFRKGMEMERDPFTYAMYLYFVMRNINGDEKTMAGLVDAGLGKWKTSTELKNLKEGKSPMN
jgi:hypothetical protein